jgi:hypothetical protein
LPRRSLRATSVVSGRFELPDLVTERLDDREARRLVAIAIDDLAVRCAHGIAIGRIALSSVVLPEPFGTRSP